MIQGSLSQNAAEIKFITLWKVVGALVSQKGMHNQELIKATMGFKCSFVSVRSMNIDLI